jgi:hypothetical protein
VDQRRNAIHEASEMLDVAKAQSRDLEAEEIEVFEICVNDIHQIDAEIGVLRKQNRIDLLDKYSHAVKPCPKCEAISSAGDNYCLHCGCQLNELIKKCSCGHINDIDNKFCTNCGKELSKK